MLRAFDRRWLFAGIVLLSLFLGCLAASVHREEVEVDYGASFSIEYSTYLGLDWQEVFLAMGDDLEIGHVRIPVTWSSVEPEQADYAYGNLDRMMNVAADRGVEVTLVVGAKTLRWPECYYPSWIDWASTHYDVDFQLAHVRATVERYREHDALVRWQVENEPMFPFGECPSPNLDLVFAEIDLVRELDSLHPVMVTTSGEQSIWAVSSLGADVLGVSLYREVVNPMVGYFVFPLGPEYYRAQSFIAEIFVDEVIVSELQAEPWLTVSPDALELDSVVEMFDARDLRRNVRFAQRVRAPEVLFWGIEWWYYVGTRGDWGLWDAARDLIRNS